MKALHRRVANDEARGIVAALMSASPPDARRPAGPDSARKRKIKLLGPSARVHYSTPDYSTAVCECSSKVPLKELYGNIGIRNRDN